ncbi:hypothetical protein PV10_04102 [Exophiala mesophila]|uniref:WD40 repeat-like protein n=1 Tax=Exophiala mesophila TaxID=212818 RepID=A0A0D2A1A5_EXOME|nr:uncharacterized protein PV10_04102 [Exophiala mesophila]KIV92838.1 hypothetical protein PV10_04102 [Exophiala mesophila]
MSSQSKINRRKESLNFLDSLADQMNQDIEYNEDVATKLHQFSQKLDNISRRLIDANTDSQAELDKISRRLADAKSNSQANLHKISRRVIDTQAELQNLTNSINRRNRAEFNYRNDARSHITSVIFNDLCLDDSQSNDSTEAPSTHSSHPADSTHLPTQLILSPISIHSTIQGVEQQAQSHHEIHGADRSPPTPPPRPRAVPTLLTYSDITVVASINSTVEVVRDQTIEVNPSTLEIPQKDASTPHILQNDNSTLETPQRDASTPHILQEDASTLEIPQRHASTPHILQNDASTPLIPQSNTVVEGDLMPQAPPLEELASEALTSLGHATENSPILHSSPNDQINSWTSVPSHGHGKKRAADTRPSLSMTPYDNLDPSPQTPSSLPQSLPSIPATRLDDEPPLVNAQTMPLSPIDEAEISLVHDIFSELGPGASRTILWQRVSDGLALLGFSRIPGSCGNAWSSSLRDVCEARGYMWAREVMQKYAYKPRKKRKRDLSIMSLSSSPEPFVARSLHKRPKQKRRGQDTAANSVAAQDFDFDPLIFQKALSWKGASWDVNALAWSSSGTHFIAGACVNGTSHSSHNLVFGSALDGVLTQLPGHQLPLEGWSVTGPKYYSVTAVRFSSNGTHAYTAGYDKTVRVWDTRPPVPRCEGVIEHTGKVEVMDVSTTHRLLATGATDGPKSILIHNIGRNGLPVNDAMYPLRKRTHFAYSPTCLQFGRSEPNKNFLVAGFSAASTAFESLSDDGHLALFQISESRLSPIKIESDNTQVFSVASFSNRSGFVCGTMSAPELTRQQKHKTQLNVYDLKWNRPVARLYCKAADINDVTICETDENLISASYTDGSIRIWDLRQPSTILLSLSHGLPFTYYRNSQDRELHDVGVRMTDWGDGAGRLFTGSSDGVIRCWNPKLSRQDAEAPTVFKGNSEIMAGVFSPDRRSLLIGDGDRGLYLLAKTLEDVSPSEAYGSFVYREFKPTTVNPIGRRESGGSTVHYMAERLGRRS